MDGLKNYICPFFFSLLFSAANSQNTTTLICSIEGRVTSVGGEPLNGAIITIKNSDGLRTLAFSITKKDGSFRLKIDPDSIRGTAFIKVEMNGFLSEQLELNRKDICNQNVPGFQLRQSVKQLNEIIIKSQPSPIKSKGDTIEFNAKTYLNPQTRKLQDLFANMQGFQVSADGKISFNGKEVEKILIEGEDLAEKNYKLISRNLNAAWVNKVQVLNNYNDDRLLKEVFQSDKIGINITVNDDVKNKLTGSLNAGAGTGSRISADNSLILLQEKIKWLSFLNYNNTGDEADADLGYFYNRDDPDQLNAGFNNESLLQTGQIFPPELSKPYIRNNSEFAGAAIASWKTGKYSKMKTMLSDSHGRLLNEAGGLQQTFLPDGTQWLIRQNQASLAKSLDWYGIMSFNHDNKADNNGYLSIDGLYGKKHDQYSNNVTGEITDKAIEYFNGKNIALRIKGYETWKHSPGKVLTLSYDGSYDQINNRFDAETSRYIDYFQIDSSWLKFSQQLENKNFTGTVEAGWFIRKKKTDYGFKWKTALLHYDYVAQNNAHDKFNHALQLSKPVSQVTSFNNSISGTSFKQLGRKQSVNLTAIIGVQKLAVNASQKRQSRLLPLYTVGLKYAYSFKPAQFLHAQYHLTSGNQRLNMFFPDSIISGNASVMHPADTLVAPVVNKINLQFVSRHMYRASSLMATFSFSFASREYLQTTGIYPSYILSGYLPVSGNRHLHFLVNAEKYVSIFRIKFVAQPSVMAFRTNTVINGLSSNNNISTIRLVGKMITGLKWPVNVELSGTALHTRNKTRAVNGDWNEKEFWQLQASSKFKVQFSEKLYFAAVYQYMRYAKPSRFQTMDIFGQYIFSSSLRLSINAHNIFNSPALVQQFVTASQYGEQRFELMGRYILFRVDWNF